MMATTTPAVVPGTVGHRIVRDIRTGSTAIATTVLAFIALAAAGVVLMRLDARTFDGVSVWLKPTRFFAALAIQLATVAWALARLPPDERGSRRITWAMRFALGAAWFEMAYIVFRAARGEASHFNTSTGFAAVMWPLMGVGAVILTSTSGYVGVRLWRHRARDLWTEAAAVALVLGAVLGTVAGAYLSARTGHRVGGDATDATGTGVVHWSTTGGDLRIAHFVGLHAAQVVLIAAAGQRRWMIYAVAIALTAATVATGVQAILGVPLFAA